MAATDYPELRPQSQSTLVSVLDWVGRPGYAVRNVLRGNLAGAGRQALDFAGEAVDAAVPFVDLYKPRSRTADYVTGSELVGVQEPGALKAALDAGVEVLTNPLGALSFGKGQGVRMFGKTVAGAGQTLDPLTLAGKGIKAGIGALPAKAQQVVGQATQWGKQALGWEDLTPEQWAQLDGARAWGNDVTRANTTHVANVFKGITPQEDTAIALAFNNVRKNGKAWEVLDRANATAQGADVPLDIQKAHLKGRLDTLLQKDGELAAGVDRARAHRVIDEMVDWNAKQWREASELGGSTQPSTLGRVDYLMRTFKREAPEDLAFAEGGARPAPLRKRTIENEDALVEHMNLSGDELEASAVRSAMKRAMAQGKIATRGMLGKAMTGKSEFALANAADVTAAKQAIEEMRKVSPDYAGRLDAAFNGTGKPGWFMDTLRSANRVFKGPAVFGVIVPRVSAAVRNQVGGLWQLISTPGGEQLALPMLQRAHKNLMGSVDDMFLHVTGSRKLAPDELTQGLDMVDEAFTAANGSAQQARAILRSRNPALAEALEQGVLDDFVREEDMIRQVADPTSQWWQLWKTPLWDAPAKLFQGIEQRMRLGTYLEARKSGMPMRDAAQMTKEAFLRYETGTAANQAFRTVVPFGQFIGQSVKQQGQFLNRSPLAAVALGGAFGTEPDDSPLPRYIEEQAHIPLGMGNDGNQNVIAGFGLPVEALNAIPNLSANGTDIGRELERGLVSKIQPLLKTAYTYVTGEDPYFDTPAGSYTKVPVLGDRLGETAGRAYNLAAGSGLIQPVDTLAKQVNNAVDDRQSIGVRAVNLLTGINIASVDPDRALSENLTDYLERNPNVRSNRSLYLASDDPQTQALLTELRETKARLKAKRQAAAAPPLQ